MKIESVKVNNWTYLSVPKGVQDPKLIEGNFLPVCIIKKRPFGFIQIDYFDHWYHTRNGGYFTMVGNENQVPNTRVIVHSSKVEEILYRLI
ncbi:MAG: hypothetical protein LLF94_12165 [Chlamydiales bacterium]|nr:hypothetical protein [Chlamydiales bacterium]